MRFLAGVVMQKVECRESPGRGDSLAQKVACGKSLGWTTWKVVAIAMSVTSVEEAAGRQHTQQLEGWMGEILCARHIESSFPAFYGRGMTLEQLP